ncbi:hypothetical protein O3P69_014261 [Scylla paramamosain]|uniref:Uncharacterized protein n=1 Tax=Scylla paramamosain TaxID=85552 RepID=A0AAW0TAF7_SCYPA
MNWFEACGVTRQGLGAVGHRGSLAPASTAGRGVQPLPHTYNTQGCRQPVCPVSGACTTLTWTAHEASKPWCHLFQAGRRAQATSIRLYKLRHQYSAIHLQQLSSMLCRKHL